MGDERQKSGDDVGPIRTGTKCLHFSSILVRFNLGKSNSDDFKGKSIIPSSRRLRVVDFNWRTLFGRGKSTCRVLV